MKVNCAAMPADLLESKLSVMSRGRSPGRSKPSRASLKSATTARFFWNWQMSAPSRVRARRPKNLQDQAGSVEHLGVPGLFQIALLHRRQCAVHDHDAGCIAFWFERGNLLDLAFAEVGGGPHRVEHHQAGLFDIESNGARKAFDRGEIDAEGKPQFRGYEGFGGGGGQRPGGGFGPEAEFETFSFGPRGVYPQCAARPCRWRRRRARRL